MTDPLTFRLLADDDLVADLAAVGVELRDAVQAEPWVGWPAVDVVVTQDPAQADAVASMLLRKMAALDADHAQHTAAYALESEALRARYERRIGPLQTERARLEAWARDLARRQHDAGGFGKKKSRDVGYGTYGVRTTASRLEVVDEPAFVAWAEAEAPDLLRVTVKLPLAQAREYLTDAELAGVKREVLTKPVQAYVATQATATAPVPLPPGVQRTPESIETYAKPEPIR